MNLRVTAAYAALCLALFTMAVLVPAPLGQYADPGNPPSDMNPPWFLRPIAALLNTVPEAVVWGAVGLVVGALIGATILANSSVRLPRFRMRFPRWPRGVGRLFRWRLRRTD